MVVQMKCCPKCIGDVFQEHGLGGEEWVCIQCGYRYEILVISRTRVPDGGRRLGIVQIAEAFDVRFDRAADSDLSRTDWVPARRFASKTVEVSESVANDGTIAALRGAA